MSDTHGKQGCVSEKGKVKGEKMNSCVFNTVHHPELNKRKFSSGCTALSEKMCLRGGDCPFYKSTSEYYLDKDLFAVKKEVIK